jgi:ATP synthase protein I
METPNGNRDKFSAQIETRQARMVRAREGQERCVWFGLGMIGTVGWSVTVPTLIGILLGIQLDSRFKSPISWTLTLMLTGLILGCVNAYFWVKKEQRKCGPGK